MPYDEISGEYYEDEVGAGEESVEDLLISGIEEIGASRRPRPPVRRAGGPPRARTYETQGAPGDTWLGFPATLVASLAAAAIPTAPQLLFKPFRLFVPSDIAGNFTIDQLIVGADNCWASGTSPVPARAFQENATPSRLRVVTAQANSNITLNCTNFSAAGSTMRAALLGEVVRRA